VDPELLLKVSPGLDGEDASVCFLMEYVFRLLGSMTTLEEHESPENSFFFIMKLLQDQVDVEGAGVQKYVAIMMFSAEVQRTGELGTRVINIEWDYTYYQPWSDNEWLVDEMLAMLDEDVTMQ